MTQTNPKFPQLQTENLKSLAWVFLALGLASIVWPAIATTAIEQLIAVFFIISGIAGVLLWRKFQGGKPGLMGVGTAVLALVLGLVLAINPLAGAETLTMLLVAFLIVEGGLSIWMAVAVRASNSKWVWPALSGAITVVLALLIVSGWPSTSTWTLGLLFGANLLSTGFALLALGHADKS